MLRSDGEQLFARLSGSWSFRCAKREVGMAMRGCAVSRFVIGGYAYLSAIRDCPRLCPPVYALAVDVDEAEAAGMRRHARTGRPLGAVPLS